MGHVSMVRPPASEAAPAVSATFSTVWFLISVVTMPLKCTFVMSYAWDRQTDRQTDERTTALLNAPYHRRGIKTASSDFELVDW